MLLCTAVDAPEGEGISGCADGGEPVHAATVAETRMAKATHLTAVSLALTAVPEVVMRTFMKPPYMSGGERPYR